MPEERSAVFARAIAVNSIVTAALGRPLPCTPRVGHRRPLQSGNDRGLASAEVLLAQMATARASGTAITQVCMAYLPELSN
jgi:hypothetical protein